MKKLFYRSISFPNIPTRNLGRGEDTIYKIFKIKINLKIICQTSAGKVTNPYYEQLEKGYIKEDTADACTWGRSSWSKLCFLSWARIGFMVWILQQIVNRERVIPTAFIQNSVLWGTAITLHLLIQCNPHINFSYK